MMVFVKYVLKATQILLLLRRVRLLVGGATCEWQGVVRVLRMLFMEDIVFAVVPVREACMIRSCLLDRPGWLNDFIDFLSGSLTLLTFVLGLVCRR